MRILVICNYFDGGPDCECSYWKVLDDEVVIDVPKPLPGNVYDLYKKESYDTLEEIWARIDSSYSRERALDVLLKHLPYTKYMEIKEMMDLADYWDKKYDDLSEMYPDRFEMKHSDPEFAEYIFNELDVYRDEHEKVVKDMKRKYCNENGAIDLGWENIHYIGLNEFCEMNHIDKVVTL